MMTIPLSKLDPRLQEIVNEVERAKASKLDPIEALRYE
jgi:hypothetical protein